MSLPIPSFAALATGNQNLSLLDTQFNAVGALTDIPCTAVGTNAVSLTPAPNTPAITAYSVLTPKFVWTQGQASTSTVTISVAGLSALNAYRNNGQIAMGSGDLAAGGSYTAYYVASLNSGAGGFVVDAVPGGTSGALVSLVNYTTAGTATITVPAGASQAYVRMWGATGGSGGAAGGADQSGGTGAGGYLEKQLTGLTPGNTLAYTQGTAGAAGLQAGPGNGGNGTVTTLASGTQVISTLTANASNGSTAAGAAATAGTAGGTATGGDINITGQTGNSSQHNAGVSPGPGGRNFFSIGADGTNAAGATAGNIGNTGGMVIIWYS